MTINHFSSTFVSVKPQHKRDSLISNQTVVEGSDVEFYCRTEAFPAATTFRWFKDGSRISNSNDYAIEEINNEESRLTVRQAKKSSAGRYSCDGENGVAIGREKSAFLIVKCKWYSVFMFSFCTIWCVKFYF